jgi:hypothetical protein
VFYSLLLTDVPQFLTLYTVRAGKTIQLETIRIFDFITVLVPDPNSSSEAELLRTTTTPATRSTSISSFDAGVTTPAPPTFSGV